MVADRGEVGSGVGAETLDDGAVEVGQVHEADGHAVGIGRCELGPAEGAGAAVNVLDDDGLADVLLSVLGKDTCGDVGAVAGLVGDYHGHGAVGSPAGGFGRGAVSGRGSLGRVSRGSRGSCRVAAAGAQREHHAQSKNQCKILFHFCFPPFEIGNLYKKACAYYHRAHRSFNTYQCFLTGTL